MGNLLIQAPTENEVLAKIEAVSDVSIRNALLAIFFWRLATQQAVAEPVVSKPSS